MDKRIKITVFTNTECSETVAYFLEEATGNLCTIYDAKDLDNCGWDYIQEGLRETYQGGVRVVTFCEPTEVEEVKKKIEVSLYNIRQNFSDCGSLTVSTETVEDVDWLSQWQKNFKPIILGDICICPKWLDAPQEADKTLFLDSGLAFGTGYHETTSQCILLCQQLDLFDKNVIDIGCGSGILGLSALKLGAKQATLIDMDLQAVQATETNAALNGLFDKCKIICGDLTQKVTDKYDICFANLTADILLRLVEDIPSVLKNGAFCVLSGILNQLSSKVLEAFFEKGFKLFAESQQGEWTALVLHFEC